jgi:excisionase family DNA binding protein
MTILARRIRAREVAEALGVTDRAIQKMAARGDLPGAAKIGKTWSFDAEKLRRHIAAREQECLTRATSTFGVRFGGCAPSSTASSSAKAYEQAMSRLLGR